MPKTIKLFDRSRVTTDWRCRRRRFWNYEYKGRGITTGTAAYELFFGIVMHDALAAIAQQIHLMGDELPIWSSPGWIDAIAEAGRKQIIEGLEPTGAVEYAYEQGALMEGLIRGFYSHMWPKLLALYPKVVVIEQEVLTPDGFMLKPDLIMESDEGTLVYIEYKTTGNLSPKWKESWETNPQLHSYLRGIKDALGIEVSAAVVVGLYKGYDYKGRRSSPMCYVHVKPGNPPFFDEEISYKYKAGFQKVPTWEMPGGVKEVVEKMPTSVLEEQFVMLPPIYLNDQIADTFFRQAKVREQEIQMGMHLFSAEDDPEMQQGCLDAFFPQNLEGCRPSFGSSCPYAPICIDGSDPDDPNFWQPREPHHQPEIEALKDG